MKAITGAMYTWGEGKLKEHEYNAYPSENTLERLKMYRGGIQLAPAKDRILCYDQKECNGCNPDNPCGFCLRQKTSYEIEQGWLRLPNRQQQCVFGKYVLTQIIGEDGNPMTAKDVAKVIGVNKDSFNRNVSRGVQRIERGLK